MTAPREGSHVSPPLIIIITTDIAVKTTNLLNVAVRHNPIIQVQIEIKESGQKLGNDDDSDGLSKYFIGLSAGDLILLP